MDNLLAAIDNFLKSDAQDFAMMINSDLRHSIRQLKQIYPGLYYFASGVGKEYKLYLSKNKFVIDYFDLTPKSKKLFIQYTGLKIDLNLTRALVVKLNPYLNLDSWFTLLSETLLAIGCEKDFHSLHFDLANKIGENLIKSTAYNEWKSLTITRNKLCYTPYPLKISPKEDKIKNKLGGIYHPVNDGNYFISIDLKGANFIVMQAQELTNAKSWSEYMSQFTDHEYFAKLKMLRLKALSVPLLYPAKQKLYWENITLTLLNNLIEKEILDGKNFAIWNSDEIIFHTTKEHILKDKIKCDKLIGNMFPLYNIAVTAFQLFFVDNNKPYYVKINQVNNKTDFVGINSSETLDAINLWTQNLNQ